MEILINKTERMINNSSSNESFLIYNNNNYNNNSISSTSNCNVLDDYGKYILNVSNKILIIYPWVMIIFGTISNILSIIVLTRKKLRKSSTFFYLACLSAIDLCVVYTFCINFITYYHLNIDLQSKHVILCKLFAFCIYFLPQYSAWTCAAVSIDRVIGVIFTIHGRYAAAAKRWNTPTRARNIVLIIGLILFLLNAQFLFYPNEYRKDSVYENETYLVTVEDVNVIYCSPENIPRYQNYYIYFWVYLDLFLNVLIPFVIMIVSSIIIIVRVQKSAQNLVNTRKKSTISYSNSAISQANTVVTNSPCSTATATTTTVYVNGQRKKSQFVAQTNSKTRNISTMLATNNFVFISLTLPIVVFLSFTPALNDDTVCANVRAKLRLIKIICIILMNTNGTVNIFVYSLMASQFRKQLIALFCEPIQKRLGNKQTRIRLFQHKSNSLLNQNLNDTLTNTNT